MLHKSSTLRYKWNTVDGRNPANRLICSENPIIYRGFSTIPTVVGQGISEPSTVCWDPKEGHQRMKFSSFNVSYDWIRPFSFTSKRLKSWGLTSSTLPASEFQYPSAVWKNSMFHPFSLLLSYNVTVSVYIYRYNSYIHIHSYITP